MDPHAFEADPREALANITDLWEDCGRRALKIAPKLANWLLRL
jgi:hypothetical protein